MAEIFSDASGDPIIIKIVSSNVTTEDNFQCELRSNIKDADSFNIWLKKFSEKTKCKWSLRTSVTSYEGSYNDFSRNYVCKYPTIRKRKKTKNTDVQENKCYASLKVRIKKYSPRKRRNDPHFNEGLCATIRLCFEHSHEVNAAGVWNWLKQSDEIRGTFVEYFKNGLTFLEAIRYHNRLSKGAKSLDEVNPPAYWVQYLYKLWKKKNHPENKDNSLCMQKELEDKKLAIIQELYGKQEASTSEQNVKAESKAINPSAQNSEVEQETSSSAHAPSVSNFMPVLIGSVKVLQLSGVASIPKPSCAEHHKDNAKRKLVPNVFPIVICGRRIISIEYFLKRLKELNKHSDSGCNLNNMFIIHEEKDGLRSCFLIKCAVCYFTTVLWTEEPKKKNLNAEAVSGMLDIGGSYTVMQELFKSMSVPVLSKSVFDKECRKIAEELPGRTEMVSVTKTAEDDSKTVESLDNGLLVEHKIEIEEEGGNDAEDFLSASVLSKQKVTPSGESMVVEPDWQPDKVVIKQEVVSDVDDESSSDGSEDKSGKAEETEVVVDKDKVAPRSTVKVEDSSDLLSAAMERYERIFKSTSTPSVQRTLVGDTGKSEHHKKIQNGKRKNTAVNRSVKTGRYSVLQVSNANALPKVPSSISTSSSNAVLGTSNAVRMVFVPRIPNAVFTPGISNVVFTPGTSSAAFMAGIPNVVLTPGTSNGVLTTATSNAVFAPGSTSTATLPGT